MAFSGGAWPATLGEAAGELGTQGKHRAIRQDRQQLPILLQLNRPALNSDQPHIAAARLKGLL